MKTIHVILLTAFAAALAAGAPAFSMVELPGDDARDEAIPLPPGGPLGWLADHSGTLRMAGIAVAWPHLCPSAARSPSARSPRPQPLLRPRSLP